MPTRKGLLSSVSRGIVTATLAALVLTSIEPPVARAAPVAPPAKNTVATTGTSDATDFSAARRRRHRGNAAAGLAFMGIVAGTIGAIAAEQRRRDYYESRYRYAPYGYYGGPGYYGYAPGYYRGYYPY